MKRSTGGESPGPLGTESWRALLAAVPQLIWTAGPDGTVDYLSERWASYTGLPLEKLRRMHWEALIHPHDRLHVLEHWQQSRANGADIDARLRLRHASGEWRWQLARGAAVHAGSGEIEHWVGTLTDIHDQVVSEQDTELLDEVGERCRRATDERELLAYVTERLASYFDAEQAFLAELELDGDSVHVAAGCRGCRARSPDGRSFRDELRAARSARPRQRGARLGRLALRRVPARCGEPARVAGARSQPVRDGRRARLARRHPPARCGRPQ
jgi:PAS domain S-box-containing protein